MGEWDASVSTEPIAAQEFNVARIFVHPQYTAANLKNDIAILRLATPVQLGQVPTITTACIPSTVVSSIRCWVAGEIIFLYCLPRYHSKYYHVRMGSQ